MIARIQGIKPSQEITNESGPQLKGFGRRKCKEWQNLVFSNRKISQIDHCRFINDNYGIYGGRD